MTPLSGDKTRFCGRLGPNQQRFGLINKHSEQAQFACFLKKCVIETFGAIVFCRLRFHLAFHETSQCLREQLVIHRRRKQIEALPRFPRRAGGFGWIGIRNSAHTGLRRVQSSTLGCHWHGD